MCYRLSAKHTLWKLQVRHFRLAKDARDEDAQDTREPVESVPTRKEIK